jgi:hypothetical protein
MADLLEEPPQLKRNASEHSTATHRSQPDLIDIPSPVGFLMIAKPTWATSDRILRVFLPPFVYQEIPGRANWRKDLLESERGRKVA